MRHIASWLRVLWNFWWDFLVGDTPELFVAAMLIVVVAIIVRPHSSVAVILLPLLAILALAASTYRGAKASRSRGSGGPK